jgi:hypothetical protein
MELANLAWPVSKPMASTQDGGLMKCPLNLHFYLTNSIEQAVAHVLYVCPKLAVTGLDIDPIVILVFSVDVAMLHGDCPSRKPSVTLTNRWFEHDNPEHCQSFLEVQSSLSMV